MRLETEATAAAAAAAAKKPVDTTMVMQRGVSLNELESGARGGFDTASKGFSRKDNKVNKIFWGAAAGFGLLILLGIIYMIMMVKS
jgi:hypothetical protein